MNRYSLIIGAALTALLAACGGVPIGANSSSAPPAGNNSYDGPDSSTSDPVTSDPTTTDPTIKDYTVVLKVTEKDCMPTDEYSKGWCNIGYRVDLGYVGPESRKPADDSSYDVTYKVTGRGMETMIGTITTTGTKYSPDTQYTQTGYPMPKMRVKVTGVNRNF